MVKTDRRKVLALAAVSIASVACAPPAPRAPPSPSPARTAMPDVAWLPSATALHVREIETGHSGLRERHLDLQREDERGSFAGVLSETHRQRPGETPRMIAREVALSTANVVALLEAARDALGAGAEPPSGRAIVVEDTSRTTRITIDVVMRTSSSPRHLQLFCDDAQLEPQPWHLRGAGGPLPRDAQVKLTAAYRAFVTTTSIAGQ